ncbi:hepatic lectin-like [Hypanus sabinus]|uniref:hepatic lectin-like n=1 Tax=Hypanus sabinus TaxID=79690 RepID=UPI0028C459EF|nr:hepatic lectin-like [Hypanus sabinus]
MSEQNLYEIGEYQLKENQQRTVHEQKPIEKAGISFAKQKKLLQIVFGLLVFSLFFSLLCLIIGIGKISAIYSEMKELQDKLMMENSQLKSNVSEFQRTQSIMVKKLSKLKINCSLTTCPGNWVRFNQSCYFFSTSSGNWHFAKRRCSLLDSHLLVINSVSEQTFIKKISAPTMYWIGLSDSAMEKNWQWEDGTSYDSTPRFWATGEPNDAFQNEDCAHLDAKGWWNDNKCSTELKWICEKDTV